MNRFKKFFKRLFLKIAKQSFLLPEVFPRRDVTLGSPARYTDLSVAAENVTVLDGFT